MLCSFHQGALPSVRNACENIGIQWKNACQLSVPKASQETAASIAATTPAVTNTRHCEAAINTSPDNYYPIQQAALIRFDGSKWVSLDK